MVNRDQSMNQDHEDSSDADAPVIVLNDEHGRSLPCFVERSVDIDGVDYVLLLPVDTPVEIFAWEADEDDEDEEILVDIEEEDIDQVFQTARAVLAEQDLSLSRTAFTLTVSGEIPEPDEDDLITLDLTGEDSDLSFEQLQLLANFFYEEQEYAIYTPLDPLLFFARLSSEGEPELLSPDEFHEVRSQLEQELFDDMD